MTVTEPPAGSDQPTTCPNCGATMPLNHVGYGCCTRCTEYTGDGAEIDRDADNSDYTHPRVSER